jgi:prepilin-type N-terminal cleavage/methylation domain-containing protein
MAGAEIQEIQIHQDDSGFSLVEVLIASSLLLMIVLGLIPIFLQSVLNNASGNESSRVSNAARSAAEQYFAYNFDHPALVVDSGTEKTFPQYYNASLGRWVDGSASIAGRQLERTITVRQYQLLDLEDNGVLDTPFASPSGVGGVVNLYPVHLREIEVEAEGMQVTGGPLGRVLNQNVTVRVLRGF